MSEVSADSLFHFTPSKEGLLGILQNGFRMSYCFEDFDEETSHFDADGYVPMARIIGSKEPRYGIAIPMICFCDIPIHQTREHREYYGSYCIGLDKEAFFEQYRAVINPVFYYFEDSWTRYILPQLVSLKKKLGRKEGVNVAIHSNDYYDMRLYIREIISLAKPYIGKGRHGKKKRFYNEREWRITFNPDDGDHSPDFIYGLQLKEFNRNRKRYNKKISNNYLTLENGTANDVISHIIVPTESEIQDMADAIENLTTIVGAKTTRCKRCKLLEKITSFQRIDKEYGNELNQNNKLKSCQTI